MQGTSRTVGASAEKFTVAHPLLHWLAIELFWGLYNTFDAHIAVLFVSNVKTCLFLRYNFLILRLSIVQCL